MKPPTPVEAASEPATPSPSEFRSRLRVGGLTLVVEHVPGVPLVAGRVWWQGGSRLESHPGQSLVAGRTLIEGTLSRTWRQLARDLEARGMSLQGFGSRDATGLALDALSSDWRLLVDWLGEVAFEPAFPEDRVDWIARQAAAELDGLLDPPDARTGQAFAAQLYAPHPYARPTQGDRASLEALDASACRDFYRRISTYGGCVAVAGAIDEDAVLSALAERFADAASSAAPEVPPAPSATAIRRQFIDLESGEQAHLYLGHRTVPRAHPDFAALELAGVVLGAGAGVAGRLPHRVREREGLAYGVDVATVAGAGFGPGRLTVALGTSTDQVEQAERAVREELERFVADGPTEEELDSGREYLIGREPFRRETVRQRANRIGEIELYGIDDRFDEVVQRLRSLSRKEVMQAVRRFVRPDELLVTIGRPKA